MFGILFQSKSKLNQHLSQVLARGLFALKGRDQREEFLTQTIVTLTGFGLQERAYVRSGRC